MADFRIRNEVGATVFALLSGLSALLLAAWAFGPDGCTDSDNPRISPLPGTQAELESIETELNAAETALAEESARRASLADEVRKTKASLNELSTRNTSLAAELEQLRAAAAENAALKANSEELAAKLKATSNAKTALAESCAEEKAKLNATIKKQQDEIAKLKKESAAPEKAPKPAPKPAPKQAAAPKLPKLDFPLLVNDPANLKPSLGTLFQGLNQVKGGPEERDKVYAELKKDGKVSDIHLVPFSVGSSDMAAKEAETLAGLVKGSEKTHKFLVVGYASTDGDSASNRKLSSERASKVAQKVVEASGVPQDNVSAVYFGQTTRFDAKNLPPNRVVEVWLLK